MKALTAAVLGTPTPSRAVDLAATTNDAAQQSSLVAQRMANGCALAVSELAQEPRRGLLLVAEHVQLAVPEMVSAARGARMAARRLDGLSGELREACDALEELGRVRWPGGPGGPAAAR
jgi:hypothetical protein